MAGTNIIEVRVVTGGTSLNPSKGSDGSAGSMIGAGAGLAKLIGVTEIMHTLLKDLLSSFKPVLTLLRTIVKLLGEFLRPIAEFAIALLQPFLAFLKPMVMLFRALMAPVMHLLRQFSNVMTSQVASGDYTGAAATGVDMIGLMLGGFFISMANVLGTMLINIIGNLLSTLATGIVTGLYTLIRPILDIFLNDSQLAKIDAKVAAINLTIEGLFDTGIASATTALQDGTDKMMGALVGHYTDKLETLKSNTELLMPKIVKPYEDTATSTEASVSKTMTTLDTNVKTATTHMTTNMNNAFNTVGLFSIPSKFGTGLSSMLTATSEFTTSMEGYATRIKAALASANNTKTIWEASLGKWSVSVNKEITPP